MHSRGRTKDNSFDGRRGLEDKGFHLKLQKLIKTQNFVLWTQISSSVFGNFRISAVGALISRAYKKKVDFI